MSPPPPLNVSPLYPTNTRDMFFRQGVPRALHCRRLVSHQRFVSPIWSLRHSLRAQYMLLCKVLQGSASEVGAIMAGKWGVKHTGAELDAMSEVAKSAKNR